MEQILDNVGSIQTYSLPLTSTPVQLASAKVIARQLTSRIAVTLINNTANTAYIGGKDVEAGTGIPVKAGETFTIPVNSSAIIHANGIYAIGDGTAAIAEYYR